MGFTNTLGLISLIALPIIIILYMLRPKNKNYILPSLYLWQIMESEIESASKLEKLKSNILMFLQLAFVIFIALMLAGLFIKGSNTAERVILVVDCSVSMKATDILPSRMEQAKTQAINYLDQLNKNTRVSLIALKDIPEILITDETNHSIVKSAINNLKATDAYPDINLAIETGNALKTEEATTIAYFGDNFYPGAENILIAKSDENAAINNISYTLYEESEVVNALVDITNESTKAATIPVSLYVDDIFFDAKQIEIEPKASAKIFFENIPATTKVIKAEIDKKDILETDNIAYTVISKATTKRVVLVSDSNIFLEKILRLNKGIELYLTDPKDIDSLKDFDLYIFDGKLPKDMPTDGAIMLFNPPENDNFKFLGYAKNPEIYTSGHEITNHIERPEFAIGATQIYELPNWASSVIDTEYGVCSFAGSLNGSPIVVFGFDLHNTDLPLVVDFPILISNGVNYLVPSNMLSQNSIGAGEAMEIRIFPNTEEAYIITPEDTKEHLDISKELVLYKNTLNTGIYTLVQISSNKGVNNELTNDELTNDGPRIEQFGVNVPIRKAIQDEMGTENKNIAQTTNQRSLYMILGIIALIIIGIEWFIYNYRRKIHAIKL